MKTAPLNLNILVGLGTRPRQHTEAFDYLECTAAQEDEFLPTSVVHFLIEGWDTSMENPLATLGQIA